MANTQHPLASDGAWVVLRDARDLKAGDQMDIQDAMTAETSGKLVREMTNALITALVVDWNLPTPLPIPADAPDALRRMELADYNRLKKLVEPAQELIFPKDSDPEDAGELKAQQADPASPTGAADAF